MDDLGLQAKIDEYTTICVSPIERETYDTYVEEDVLGGELGYFVIRTSRKSNQPIFEILAKAPSFQAAGEIFDMIVTSNRSLAA